MDLGTWEDLWTWDLGTWEDLWTWDLGTWEDLGPGTWDLGTLRLCHLAARPGWHSPGHTSSGRGSPKSNRFNLKTIAMTIGS